jgi:putative membrane protein
MLERTFVVAVAALAVAGVAMAQGAKPNDAQIAHIAYTADNIDIAAANPQVRLRLQAELAPAMAGVRAGTLPFAGADASG